MQLPKNLQIYTVLFTCCVLRLPYIFISQYMHEQTFMKAVIEIIFIALTILEHVHSINLTNFNIKLGDCILII